MPWALPVLKDNHSLHLDAGYFQCLSIFQHQMCLHYQRNKNKIKRNCKPRLIS